ncbi:uncharacterized protein LOC119743012 [Patiria miniata]|uniref:Uncharacterized protein n=1 Tax=Patiria miniata TaxID=46514 RepID=A0A914BIJ0_PATMI|nr:uncharacterized protein LOC119743012 [Patiria miniata]
MVLGGDDVLSGGNNVMQGDGLLDGEEMDFDQSQRELKRHHQEDSEESLGKRWRGKASGEEEYEVEHPKRYYRLTRLEKYDDPDGMNEEGRTEFNQWYDEESGRPFVLKDELLAYCISDIDILSRCCQQFRLLFKQVTSLGPDDDGVDPFKNCI